MLNLEIMLAQELFDQRSDDVLVNLDGTVTPRTYKMVVMIG